MKKLVFSFVCLLVQLFASEVNAGDVNTLLPRTGITAQDLAIVVNDNDPQSVNVGEYYQEARKIPAANVIHVRFQPSAKEISVEEFKKLKAQIDAATPTNVQAYAVTWTGPYRVGCMSITSALAFGYDPAYCGNCKATKASPYFNSPSLYPYNELKMRPAMMLAGSSFENVKALIDRGVASDSSFPKGNAYLLSTSDKARNVRAIGFEEAKTIISPAFTAYVVKHNEISFKQNVMFYFTGVATIGKLNTLKFLPGAFADTLTSWGGMLAEPTGQTTALQLLEAGATASYGTVVEPCNHIPKFPTPVVAMFHYITGATALEAYWKSVAWPGEGLFVGEPLAKPFAPLISALEDDNYELNMFSPNQRMMLIQKAESVVGPYSIAGQYEVKPGLNTIKFKVNKDAQSQSTVQLRW